MDNHNDCTIDECKVKTKNIDKKEKNVDKKIYCGGNFCMVCNCNMGDINPRQLCGKTYCKNT